MGDLFALFVAVIQLFVAVDLLQIQRIARHLHRHIERQRPRSPAVDGFLFRKGRVVYRRLARLVAGVDIHIVCICERLGGQLLFAAAFVRRHILHIIARIPLIVLVKNEVFPLAVAPKCKVAVFQRQGAVSNAGCWLVGCAAVRLAAEDFGVGRIHIQLAVSQRNISVDGRTIAAAP